MRLILSILLVVSFLCVNAQFQDQKICDLPTELRETSGLVILNDSLFLTINDKGGEPIVYAFDENGIIRHQVWISNASNTDWESLALRDDSTLIIGDFGNNLNDRQDLRLYLLNPEYFIDEDTLEVDTAYFIYEDQEGFPPKFEHQHFDAEASFYLNDSLYIFTKDRTIPFEGKTKLYGVRPTQGPHTGWYVDERSTHHESEFGSITGAAIHDASNQTALMSYGALWLFKESKFRPFFNGELNSFIFDDYARREALYFKNEFYNQNLSI